MVSKLLLSGLIFLSLVFPFSNTNQNGGAGKENYLPLVMKPMDRPRLKWKEGGCYSSWCETGWYSSPAVVDINNDGISEIIASAYSVTALDGATGETLWRSGTTDNRTWPGIVIADLDQNATDEIVVAQGGGLVSAYRLDGSRIWQKNPSGDGAELRGLLVSNIDTSTEELEIVVTRAGGGSRNTWMLDHNGSVLTGWPQLVNPPGDPIGYAAGVYNTNAAAGNIFGDADLEIIVPSDVHYINAYEAGGALLQANATDYPEKTWGLVGAWENLTVEKRGWGDCNGVRAESYRTNFADGPAVIADFDGNGIREVAVTGNMYNCAVGHPPGKYMALFLFNADRSRFNHTGFNWSSIPTNTGAPLSENYNIIESAQPNPTAADLDGDGKLEILYASYDGRLHAFWLDKTEHGGWPYSVQKASESIFRFASEPVVADLENDGQAEVMFTSWTQKGSHRSGSLHIMSSMGQVLSETPLPGAKSSSENWNGGLGAPTIANVDADADYEVIILTANSGVVVYDLPGTSAARLIWPTGRGSFYRQGSR